MATKPRPESGTWYKVPLASGRHALCFAARTGRKRGGTFVAYFFGPYDEDDATSSARIPELSASDAVRVVKVSSLGVEDGSWVPVQQWADWDRDRWPNPIFGGAGYRIYFREDDPGEPVTMLPSQPGDENLPRDGSDGHVYSQLRLDQLATEDAVRAYVVAAPTGSSQAGEPEASGPEPDQHAVLLHFGLESRGWRSRERLDRLEEDLSEAVEEQGVGEFDGVDHGSQDATFYLYGPDGDALWAAVEPILRSAKIAARVVVRAGGPGATERGYEIG